MREPTMHSHIHSRLSGDGQTARVVYDSEAHRVSDLLELQHSLTGQAKFNVLSEEWIGTFRLGRKAVKEGVGGEGHASSFAM